MFTGSAFKIGYSAVLIAFVIVVGVFVVYILKNQNKAAQYVPTLIKKSLPTSSSPAASQIIVDISGGVVKPGVYTLPEKSTLADLIKLSGGLTTNVDKEFILTELNFSQLLKNNEKYYIRLNINSPTYIGSDYSSESPSGNQSSDNSSINTSTLLNINSASQSSLESLSGIGPAYAQKIIDNRPYTALSELVSKKAISQTLFDKIKSNVTL